MEVVTSAAEPDRSVETIFSASHERRNSARVERRVAIDEEAVPERAVSCELGELDIEVRLEELAHEVFDRFHGNAQRWR